MTCRCGHERAAHRHYRAGSDCGLCNCHDWSPRRWWSRLHAWLYAGFLVTPEQAERAERARRHWGL